MKLIDKRSDNSKRNYTYFESGEYNTINFVYRDRFQQVYKDGVKIYNRNNNIFAFSMNWGVHSFSVPKSHQILLVSGNSSMEASVLHTDGNKLYMTTFLMTKYVDGEPVFESNQFEVPAEEVRVFDDAVAMKLTPEKWHVMNRYMMPVKADTKEPLKEIKESLPSVFVDKDGDPQVVASDNDISFRMLILTDQKVIATQNRYRDAVKSLIDLSDNIDDNELDYIKDKLKSDTVKMNVGYSNALFLLEDRLYSISFRLRFDPEIKQMNLQDTHVDDLYSDTNGILAYRKGNQLTLLHEREFKDVMLPEGFDVAVDGSNVTLTMPRSDLTHVEKIQVGSYSIYKLEYPDDLRFLSSDEDDLKSFRDKLLNTFSTPGQFIDTDALAKMIKSPHLFEDLRLCS